MIMNSEQREDAVVLAVIGTAVIFILLFSARNGLVSQKILEALR